MTQPQTPYIGSKISLISMLDIRYEGILYTVNSQESTIALSKVRSFGTEDRQTLRSVPARDEVYEFIIFKASDIKDLVVCESPKTSVGPAYDPAIISVSNVESQDSQTKEPPTGSSPSEDQSQPVQFPSYGQQSQQQGSNAQSRGGFGRSRRTNDGDRPNDSNSVKPLQNRQQQDHGSNNAANANNNYRQRQQYNNNNAHYNRNNDFTDHRQHHNTNNFNRSHNRQYHQGGNAGNNQQRERFKFDGDFDFEKANEKFKEQLGAVTTDISKINVEGDENVEEVIRSRSPSPVEEVKETFYNKSTSFFDNISCEALEKTEGKNTRPDWKKERMTNQETFGHSAVRSLAYRRGQRGFNGGGNGSGGNLHNRPSYQQQNYNNYNNNNNNNYQKRNYHQNQQQRQNYGGNQGGNYGNNGYRQNHQSQNQQRPNHRNQDHHQGNGRRQSQQNRADL